mmetsp:Transcript_10010/g.34534  ORF Transcript_10010/g.34534 Transcript_10010/m.34534 type:complete len:259 (+) Transcript_10010:447-1223(+)
MWWMKTSISALRWSRNLEMSATKMRRLSATTCVTFDVQFFSRDTQRYCRTAPTKRAPPRNDGPACSSTLSSSSRLSTLDCMEMGSDGAAGASPSPPPFMDSLHSARKRRNASLWCAEPNGVAAARCDRFASTSAPSSIVQCSGVGATPSTLGSASSPASSRSAAASHRSVTRAPSADAHFLSSTWARPSSPSAASTPSPTPGTAQPSPTAKAGGGASGGASPRASCASMRWKTMESICVSVALAVVLFTALRVTRWML